MNYLQYYPIDVVNGPGTRCTLFVSGCEHFCPGCHNSSTWDANKGFVVDKAMEDQIIADLNDPRIIHDGLSLSGGDPLYPGNVAGILQLVKRVKAETQNKNIWLWTGYRVEELTDAQREVLAYIDVVVDGRFVLAEKDLRLAWRGSRNQRILKAADWQQIIVTDTVERVTA